jgi:tetratricopeptide (TPR) repeat protein
MKLNEEKELARITEAFTKGVTLFTQKEVKNALAVFDQIIEEFKDSEYYSIEEIQTRAKVYKAICESLLNPVEIKLETDEDYLNQGVYHLNAGQYAEAIDMFQTLESRGYTDPYLNYLLSIVHLKKREFGTCFSYLKKCVQEDDYYKIVAHNEPDFIPILEHREFLAIVE